ncbi:MAG TPA: GGDEF domain-containing protein [Thiotrichales bacterium]|nr:GGDEF domain-containing protein [Thiotrichales bacterium]
MMPKSLNQFFIGQLYTSENNALLRRYQSIIEQITPQCAQAFYEVLLTDHATKRFFTSELVETHLKNDLQLWLNETLSEKTTEAECVATIHKQRSVGEIHARIDVPMQLVNSAMSIIKKVLFETIKMHDSVPVAEKTDLIILLDQLLDASLSLINESYLEGRVENERSAQEYRSRSTAHEIAIEIERVKGALYGWMTQFMADLLTTQQRIVDIHHQEFSLWIRHKLNFVSPNDKLVRQIKLSLDNLQLALDHLYHSPNTDREETIQKISALTNECGWLLGQIADQNIESAAREDALTSLIERRFLAPIMQNETQMALKTKTPYTVLMVDVDNFKSVNDIHGHQAGDAVLSTIGRILKRSLRVTDYAFRYGGEEFLILMPETSAKSAERAAEKLLEKIRTASVRLDNGRTLKMTVSIGLAQFDDHPDFEHVIKHADEKLYEAKHNGKDRYEA